MLIQTPDLGAGEAGHLGTSAKAGLGRDGASGPAQGDTCPQRVSNLWGMEEAAPYPVIDPSEVMEILSGRRSLPHFDHRL